MTNSRLSSIFIIYCLFLYVHVKWGSFLMAMVPKVKSGRMQVESPKLVLSTLHTKACVAKIPSSGFYTSIEPDLVRPPVPRSHCSWLFQYSTTWSFVESFITQLSTSLNAHEVTKPRPGPPSVCQPAIPTRCLWTQKAPCWETPKCCSFRR